MAKEVLLIADLGSAHAETQWEFETTGEAIKYAEQKKREHSTFHIYTLFKTGTFGGIQWKLSADTATNLRETAKAEALKEAPRKYKPWTNLEIQTVKDSYHRGVEISAIAEALNRTYKSVYGKLWKLGVIQDG